MKKQVCAKVCQTDGNTKSPSVTINPSKHWCFTLNNYTKSDIENICSVCAKEKYIFQEEKGSQGTPHLQGYIGFTKKVRPKNLFTNDKIHWEICRNIDASIAYCQKEETRSGLVYTNMPIPRVDKRLPSFTPREWQKELYETLLKEPDDRTIIWVVNERGECGKSLFCKWMNWKHPNYISITMNKSADILTMVEDHYVGYLLDLPRCYDVKYTPYNAIEQIKNGYVTECKLKKTARVLNFAPPHVVIFSNNFPDVNKLSKDRWKIINIL